MWVQWLYSGDSHIDKTIEKEGDDFYVYLFKAFVVAETLQDNWFKKAVLGALYDEPEAWPGCEAVEYAYSEEVDCKALKAIVIDYVLTDNEDHSSLSSTKEAWKDYPREALLDIAACLWHRGKKKFSVVDMMTKHMAKDD